eukprot:3582891-Pleurochrysis_carterae.AAC.2
MLAARLSVADVWKAYLRIWACLRALWCSKVLFVVCILIGGRRMQRVKGQLPVSAGKRGEQEWEGEIVVGMQELRGSRRRLGLELFGLSADPAQTQFRL